MKKPSTIIILVLLALLAGSNYANFTITYRLAVAETKAGIEYQGGGHTAGFQTASTIDQNEDPLQASREHEACINSGKCIDVNIPKASRK